MHKTEAEREHPPPISPRTDDVLERHVDDRERNEHFDQRRKPKRIRRKAHRGGDERDRVRDGERGDDRDERPDAPNGNHETQHEQQVVDAAEYVRESQADEGERGLVPLRIELHQAWITVVLKCALDTARWQEAKRRTRPKPKVGERWVNREVGLVGGDAILE